MIYRILLVAAGPALLAIFIVAWPDYLPSNSSEWASWVQAIGSIGAIGGAVWISRVDQRRVADERLALAEVTCSSMLHRLGDIEGFLEECIRRMRSENVLHTDFAKSSDEIDHLQLPQADELAKLVPVSGEVAIELAQVTSGIQITQGQFVRHDGAGQKPLQDRRLTAQNLADFCELARDKTKIAKEGIVKFLRQRGHIVED